MTTAPGYIIDILKLLIKTSTDGVNNAYGNALAANHEDDDTCLRALLLTMDQESAKKATIPAGLNAFDKIYNKARTLPKLEANGIAEWLDEIERLMDLYVLIPTDK